jgi:hypothetical protein
MEGFCPLLFLFSSMPLFGDFDIWYEAASIKEKIKDSSPVY